MPRLRTNRPIRSLTERERFIFNQNSPDWRIKKPPVEGRGLQLSGMIRPIVRTAGTKKKKKKK